MMKQIAISDNGLRDTRQRILAQACRIFAEKGFNRTTIAETCRGAGANIAAVNYHFGSKAKLYVEVWRYALASSLKTHPPDGGVPVGAPPEERLKGRIRSLLERITDPGSYDLDIVHKEMANPTGLLAQAMHNALGPMRSQFEAIIRELLGGNATARQIRLCHMSIMAQCFGPVLRERRRKRLPTRNDVCQHEPLTENVEALADHVYRFSLAGIREIADSAAGHPRRGTVKREGER